MMRPIRVARCGSFNSSTTLRVIAADCGSSKLGKATLGR